MAVNCSDTRFDRNIRLFGEEGQEKLRRAIVCVVGLGGLGSAVAQHLALLGVGQIAGIEPEQFEDSNRNRFIGAKSTDKVPGTTKLEIVERSIKEIDPKIEFDGIDSRLESKVAFDAIKSASWVIGCLDHDGPRYILNELCSAYARPLIDAASDIPSNGIYGGRVCVIVGHPGCLHCLDLLDAQDVHSYLSAPDEREKIADIYGVPVDQVTTTGPSVSPINGVVAAIAAVELMVGITGLRSPVRLSTYHGHLSKVLISTNQPQSGCPICTDVRNSGIKADVERYLRMAHFSR